MNDTPLCSNDKNISSTVSSEEGVPYSPFPSGDNNISHLISPSSSDIDLSFDIKSSLQSALFTPPRQLDGKTAMEISVDKMNLQELLLAFNIIAKTLPLSKNIKSTTSGITEQFKQHIKDFIHKGWCYLNPDYVKFTHEDISKFNRLHELQTKIHEVIENTLHQVKQT